MVFTFQSNLQNKTTGKKGIECNVSFHYICVLYDKVSALIVPGMRTNFAFGDFKSPPIYQETNFNQRMFRKHGGCSSYIPTKYFAEYVLNILAELQMFIL